MPRALLVGLACLWATLPTPVRADAVDVLVSEISQARVETHVMALEGFRHSATQRGAARAYIRGLLESYGYTVTEDKFPNGAPFIFNLDPNGVNLVAEQAGETTPSQIFIVGAHYDTFPGSPGADDNATGVAAVIEIARAFAQARFESTIRFILFDLEEDGLVGSLHSAMASGAGSEHIVRMTSFDMIGYACFTPGCQAVFSDIPGCFEVEPDGLNVGDGIGSLANSQAQLDEFTDAADRYVPSLKIGEGLVLDGNGSCNPLFRRSDHAPYWDQGYSAMLLTDTAEARNPNYHTPTDTSATLNFELVSDVTRATAAATALGLGVISPSIPALPWPALVLLAASLLAAGAWRAARRPR